MKNRSVSSFHHANRIHLPFHDQKKFMQSTKNLRRFSSSSSSSRHTKSIVSCSRLEVIFKEADREINQMIAYSLKFCLTLVYRHEQKKPENSSKSLFPCIRHIGCDNVVFKQDEVFSSSLRKYFLQLEPTRKWSSMEFEVVWWDERIIVMNIIR